jgi:small subunit ribosomal protein S20
MYKRDSVYLVYVVINRKIIIMPNLQNAKKALRQARKRTIENKVVKNAMKSAVKDLEKAIAAGETDLKVKFELAQKKLDKAAKKGVIKSNTASRKISRLTKRMNDTQKKK